MTNGTMTGIDYFAWLVLLVIVVSGLIWRFRELV